MLMGPKGVAPDALLCLGSDPDTCHRRTAAEPTTSGWFQRRRLLLPAFVAMTVVLAQIAQEDGAA